MNSQRIVLLGASLIGAASVLLPWRQLGILTVPLTHDVEAAALLGLGFVIAALLTLRRDRSKPLKAFKGLAAGCTIVGLLLIGFTALICTLLPEQVGLGIGVYVAFACAGLVALGAWADLG